MVVCLEIGSKLSAQVFHRYRVIFSQHSEFSQPEIGLAFISKFLAALQLSVMKDLTFSGDRSDEI